MSGKDEGGKNRRDFLKLAATAAPLTAAAVVSGGRAEAAEPDLASDKMQDTAHTRAYYESTRF
ncbi:hypothetical protein RSK20926_13894 [Roseobacter sp. SK209-2-6]|uniref:hypothetical protein n=1 Tax=Roseobacter sp. SK209-2-6 TaxID=388739 RepID=UPI0000F3D657|nr:hypothetical protein [Roseobacter sp. SK209-2-6]EBA15728.1 hypothetical protein RSK20926_13894 [Roseobacter sp. SK209-2-6]